MPLSGDFLETIELEATRTLSVWRRLTAPQLLAGSFLGLIAFGTAVLLLVPGLYTADRLSFVDALFTATTAVCITGLMIVDVGTYFTPFGQAVLLGLIQIGGLGILTLTTVVILWLGRRPSLREEAVFGGAHRGAVIEPARLVRGILRYTLLIEAAGALALWITWAPDLGLVGAIWPAVFHAVSAFCNAGISIFRDSLIDYGTRPVSLTIIMALVVLGGLGFLVLEELNTWRRRRGQHRVSLHTRLVLLAALILIPGGALLFAIFEWTNVLADAPWYVRPVQALFLSVMPRSGGFNTVPYDELTSASLLLSMILMLIGGAPGSTAGGLKTTTVAVLVALAIARARGRPTIHAFRRTIPESTIQRSVGLVIFVIALLAVALLILLLTELRGVPAAEARGMSLDLGFEAVSAINTVGLSVGITPELSNAGKVLLSILMYIGRVGPLTIAASMVVAAQRRRVRIRYATEDVIIG